LVKELVRYETSIENKLREVRQGMAKMINMVQKKEREERRAAQKQQAEMMIQRAKNHLANDEASYTH